MNFFSDTFEAALTFGTAALLSLTAIIALGGLL